MSCRPNPLDARAVLGAVKAERAALRAGLDRACARRRRRWAGRDEGTAPARTKELDDETLTTEEPRRGLREETERWRSVFPAPANTGDPNGPLEAGPLIRSPAR